MPLSRYNYGEKIPLTASPVGTCAMEGQYYFLPGLSDAVCSCFNANEEYERRFYSKRKWGDRDGRKLQVHFRVSENSGRAFPFKSAWYHWWGKLETAVHGEICFFDRSAFYEYIRESWFFWIDKSKWEIWFSQLPGNKMTPADYRTAVLSGQQKEQLQNAGALRNKPMDFEIDWQWN